MTSTDFQHPDTTYCIKITFEDGHQQYFASHNFHRYFREHAHHFTDLNQAQTILTLEQKRHPQRQYAIEAGDPTVHEPMIIDAKTARERHQNVTSGEWQAQWGFIMREIITMTQNPWVTSPMLYVKGQLNPIVKESLDAWRYTVQEFTGEEEAAQFKGPHFTVGWAETPQPEPQPEQTEP